MEKSDWKETVHTNEKHACAEIGNQRNRPFIQRDGLHKRRAPQTVNLDLQHPIKTLERIRNKRAQEIQRYTMN